MEQVQQTLLSTFIDRTANVSNIAYYRLFDISFDGTSDYSDAISIVSNCNNSAQLFAIKNDGIATAKIDNGTSYPSIRCI